MKILAIDDDQMIIAIFKEILAEEYDLVTATSGEDGLVAAERLKPDLILLDVMMPGIDGYETCRRIRSKPDLKDVKVLLVSAKSMTLERLKGYEAGADDFVTKPFDTNELLAKIRVFLRLRSVEEMDRMQRQLLSLVAHEIRTPLTGIIPGCEALKSEEPMEESERRMWAEMIYHNSHRLLDLAEKGLLLCQFTADQIPMNVETFDLVDLAQTVLRDLDAAARKKNIEVVFAPSDPVLVDGDKKYMKIVLEAVLDNAVKFSIADSQIHVDICADGQSATFSVDNFGSEEVDPKEVFGAFSPRRVDNKLVGSGMSMALSRAIMRVHDGDLEIKSRPSERTICSGQLPLHTATAPVSDWD